MNSLFLRQFLCFHRQKPALLDTLLHALFFTLSNLYSTLEFVFCDISMDNNHFPQMWFNPSQQMLAPCPQWDEEANQGKKKVKFKG